MYKIEEEYEFAVQATTLNSGIVYHTPIARKVQKKWWQVQDVWTPIVVGVNMHLFLSDLEELLPKLETNEEAEEVIKIFKAQQQLRHNNSIDSIKIKPFKP